MLQLNELCSSVSCKVSWEYWKLAACCPWTFVSINFSLIVLLWMKALFPSSAMGKEGNILHVIYPSFEEKNYWIQIGPLFTVCSGFDFLCRREIFFFTYILLSNTLTMWRTEQDSSILGKAFCWSYWGIRMSTYHLNSALQVPALRVVEVGILQLGLPHLLKQFWLLSYWWGTLLDQEGASCNEGVTKLHAIKSSFHPWE